MNDAAKWLLFEIGRPRYEAKGFADYCGDNFPGENYVYCLDQWTWDPRKPVYMARYSVETADAF
jgi:hypothetical protein